MLLRKLDYSGRINYGMSSKPTTDKIFIERFVTLYTEPADSISRCPYLPQESWPVSVLTMIRWASSWWILSNRLSAWFVYPWATLTTLFLVGTLSIVPSSCDQFIRYLIEFWMTWPRSQSIQAVQLPIFPFGGWRRLIYLWRIFRPWIH